MTATTSGITVKVENRKSGDLQPEQEYRPEADQRGDDIRKHHLLIWKGLVPGDVVTVRTFGKQDYAGTVEHKTIDGRIIWIRNYLNERKLFHFGECQSVVLIASTSRQ